jgi:hypothetical protein
MATKTWNTLTRDELSLYRHCMEWDEQSGCCPPDDADWHEFDRLCAALNEPLCHWQDDANPERIPDPWELPSLVPAVA